MAQGWPRALQLQVGARTKHLQPLFPVGVTGCSFLLPYSRSLGWKVPLSMQAGGVLVFSAATGFVEQF